MYSRKRVGKRRSFAKKHRVLLLFMAGICAGLFAFVFTRAIRNQVDTASFRSPASRPQELIQKFQPAKYGRIVYPYSVIPGGVRSREELASSISSDGVVAAHFADFKVGKTKIVRTEQMQFVYVSYRMRNKVYWTAKTVKLPKGEALITDGKAAARTRCGNQVSATPKEPVSEEEPAIETFDVPMAARPETPALETSTEAGMETREFTPRLDIGMGAREFTPLEPLIPIPTSRPQILPFYYRPIFPMRPPGMVVPEPGTLGLLMAGLAVFGIARFTRKK